MKLVCKCGEVLTKDLYHTKKWGVSDTCEDYGSDWITKHWFEVREGSFQLSKQQCYRWLFMPEHYLVNPNDVFDQEQLQFKRGEGCCGNHFTQYSCPSCGVEVGHQFLDCYDDKHVILFNNKVNRKYN